MTLLVALAALSAAVPAAPPAPRGDVAAVIERCVKAYGGAEALSRARAMRQEGTVTSTVLRPGQTGRLVRAHERSGRLRVEIAYPGDPIEVRVLDGSQGWRFGEPVSGPLLTSMILQAARMDLPALLHAFRDRVVDRGTVEDGGRALRVLALEVAPAVEVEAAIDLESGRIVRSRGTAAGGPPVQFVTSYDDFRVVGGVLVAFREGNWANGRATGETVLTKVEILASLPAATFRP